jgi:glycosyltransferase involved in cell wall biosynthesis
MSCNFALKNMNDSLKIAFDAKRLFHNLTGLGNYSRTLLETLVQYYPENEYHLFTTRDSKSPRLDFLKQKPCIKTHFPQGIASWNPSLWRTFCLKNEVPKSGSTIFHGLSNELPIGMEKSGLKTIVTIHDLIFERFPEYYSFSAVNVPMYRYKFRSACERADIVVAVSEMTALDIETFYKIPRSKIRVLYQSCHPQFYKRGLLNPEIRKKVLQKYNLPTEYMLYVGTVNPRKNLLTLLKALCRLPKDCNLVVIGEGTAYFKQCKQFVFENKLEKRVFWLQKADFADFPAIYQSAQLFLLPSYFEGFGIPIIEALHSGVPVLTSEGSCFAEAGGENSIYLPPDDVEDWIQNIQKVWIDHELRQKMIHYGRIHVQQFEEEAIGKQWIQLYNLLN